MSKFAKDTRVMRDFKTRQSTYHITRGVTITDPVNDALTGKEKVYVKWDKDSYRRLNPEEVPAENLLTEEEGDAKFNKMEEEYAELEEAVAAKIQKAANLIEEAGKMAAAKGESLQQMHEAVGSLIDAMDGAGWNTSSWGC